MRFISILCVLAAPGYAAWPTRGVIFNGSAQTHGVHYRFATVVEPHVSDSDLRWGNPLGGGFSYLDGREHRVMFDAGAHLFFGYDLLVERVDRSSSCRATISPLSLSFEEFSRHTNIDTTNYKALALPTYPAAQIVHPGDTLAVDLLVSPDGKRKVIDYIQLSCEEAAVGSDGSPSRDFSPQDVELRVVEPTLIVNGHRVDAPGLHGEAVGNILWFYVPGEGRFLLSLTPFPGFGFRKAGTLAGSGFSFQFGSDRYSVRSSEPLFRSAQAWNLYVRADTSYQSKQGAAFGGSDRPEHILTNR